MPPKSRKNAASRNTSGRKQPPKPRPARSVNGTMGVAEKWKRLLSNPCDADLINPPYAGADSGYLIRTTDNYSPSGTVTAGQTKMDFVLTYAPWNLSNTTGLQVGGGDSQSTFAISTTGLFNFIATSTAVREYRPVAACLKWVPTGATGIRSGLVSLGYSAGTPFIVTAPGTGNTGQIKAIAQRNATNGSECHEVNWIPTGVDELFTTVTQGSQGGAGCVFLGLNQVDCTTVGTTGTPVGFVEITTVWEWIPDRSSGVSIPLKTPSPYTTQQILASFPNIASVVLAGVHRGMRMMTGPGMGQVLSLANGFLRSGMSYQHTRAQGLLTY